MKKNDGKWIPKYKEIANKIYDSIIKNKLLGGAKLPGGRSLASYYGVSKNTVYEALEYLEREGVIEIKRDLGSFVTKEAWAAAMNGSPDWESYIHHGWQRIRDPILDNVYCKESSSHGEDIYISIDCLHESFNAGKYVLDTLKDVSFEIASDNPLTTYEFQGSVNLRKTVASYLSGRWKCPDIDYGNIIITPGLPNSIDVIFKGLSSQGDIIYTENPIFCLPMQQLLSLGQRVIGIEMDDEGIIVEDLYKNFRKSERPMLMVSPNGHYPTGRSMSVERRKELLEMCAAVNLPIVEMDSMYDFDEPMPSLMSMDKHNLVIYLGSIAVPYAFGLGTSWILAPDYLVKRLGVVSMESNHYPAHITHVITEKLLANGHYDRFVAGFMPMMRKRMDLTNRLLNKYFADLASWYGESKRGIIYIKMNDNISVRKMSRYADGVRFASGAIFDKDDNSHIILNPFSMSESDLEEGLKRLQKAAFAGYK